MRTQLFFFFCRAKPLSVPFFFLEPAGGENTLSRPYLTSEPG